jgi:hypothetical protein
MNDKDLLAVLVMTAPTVLLIAALVLGLVLVEPRPSAPEAKPGPVTYSKVAETARCNSSESREQACR